MRRILVNLKSNDYVPYVLTADDHCNFSTGVLSIVARRFAARASINLLMTETDQRVVQLATSS
jgi:hypothetical protein